MEVAAEAVWVPRVGRDHSGSHRLLHFRAARLLRPEAKSPSLRAASALLASVAGDSRSYSAPGNARYVYLGAGSPRLCCRAHGLGFGTALTTVTVPSLQEPGIIRHYMVAFAARPLAWSTRRAFRFSDATARKPLGFLMRRIGRVLRRRYDK